MLHKALFYFLSSILVSFSFFASDIYLPSMVQIATEVGTRSSGVQGTVSLYFLGVALSQPFYLLLLQRIGHWNLLIFGVVLGVVSSISCAVSINMHELYLFRFIQGIAVGSCIIIGRLIAEQNRPTDFKSRVFLLIIPYLLLSLAIGPILGSYLTVLFGWRAVFIATAIVFVVLAIVTSFYFQRYMKDVDFSPYSFVRTLKASKYLFMHRQFVGYMLVLITPVVALFAYAAEAPFLLHRIGYSITDIGFSYAPIALAFFIAGFVIQRPIAKNVNRNILMLSGLGLFLLGPILLSGLAIYAQVTPWVVILSMAIMAFGHGMTAPIAYVNMLELMPEYDFTASRLVSVMQFLLMALGVLLVGPLSMGHVFPLALYLTIIAILGVFGLMGLVLSPNREPRTNSR